MPITLSKIANNTADVTINCGEDTVTVIYYPTKITEKTFMQLDSFDVTSADSVIGSFGTLNDILVHLIKSWDVFEDDEQTVMYPLTTEALAELPIMFRMNVLQAIMSDARPETPAPVMS